ncbi:hypothetical protein VP1G_11232 [Cytospora mali]|uniref:Uncharacterized protein n=1 Tax=Cytospora mali TaxID=578113 RepID=A0A194VB78_CYTMA|nr:hypothetical protein VP1G_11232 [Valsa mali var. pyri (nom. inval.)]
MTLNSWWSALGTDYQISLEVVNEEGDENQNNKVSRNSRVDTEGNPRNVSYRESNFLLLTPAPHDDGDGDIRV